MGAEQSEPWLRGTLTDVPVVQRAVLHALELAAEDIEKWCGSLSDEQLNARPAELAPVAFHLRHIARSMDRLLTYAEGRELTGEQFAALQSELVPGANREAAFAELAKEFVKSAERIRAIRKLASGRTAQGRQAATSNDGWRIINSHSRAYAAPCGPGDYDQQNRERKFF